MTVADTGTWEDIPEYHHHVCYTVTQYTPSPCSLDIPVTGCHKKRINVATMGYLHDLGELCDTMSGEITNTQIAME